MFQPVRDEEVIGEYNIVDNISQLREEMSQIYAKTPSALFYKEDMDILELSDVFHELLEELRIVRASLAL